MRPISILSLAAATASAALVASSAAEAAYRGGYRGPAVHAGYARPAAVAHRGYVRPGYAPRAWAAGHRYGYGYNRAWRARGVGYAAGAAVGAAAGYAAASSYGYGGGYAYGGDVGYAAPAANYGYAQPAYGYAQPAGSWSQTYLVPRTVLQPVVRTAVVPVTTYRTVQSTAYVPTTVYNAVTKTCSCTINGVTQQVPCEGGYGAAGLGVSVGFGGGYSRGPIYNRPGLFTSGW